MGVGYLDGLVLFEEERSAAAGGKGLEDWHISWVSTEDWKREGETVNPKCEQTGAGILIP